MVSLSIRPLAACGNTPNDNLSVAPEYLTCFANILHCHRVFEKHNRSKRGSICTPNDQETLTSCVGWFHNVLSKCIVLIGQDDTTTSSSIVRAAALAFVHAHLMIEQDGLRTNKSLIGNLRAFLQGRAWKTLLETIPAIGDSSPMTQSTVAACACLYQLCQVMATLGTAIPLSDTTTKDNNDDDDGTEETTKVVMLFRSMLLQWLQDTKPQGPIQQQPQDTTVSNTTAATRHTMFSIAKFLGMPSLSQNDQDEQELVRSFAFQVIGQLQHGEEAMAAILLGNDAFFQASSSSSPSVLSSTFMSVLCSGDHARAQVDHSFKLLHGFGISPMETGMFSLDSLRSEAEPPTTRPTSTTRTGKSSRGPKKAAAAVNTVPYEPLLPMGPCWLWKTLSGALTPQGHVATASTIPVMLEALRLLRAMESEYDGTGDTFYSKTVPRGAKLYFVANLCLLPESILQNEALAEATESLLDVLEQTIDNEFGKDLVTACYDHSVAVSMSSSSSSTNSNNDGDSGGGDGAGKASGADSVENDETVHDQTGHTELMNILNGTPTPKSRMLRVVKDFTADLCNGFVEYGAQYRLYVRCVRLLLLPSSVPAAIRCEALERLRDVLPLLSLPSDEKDMTDETTGKQCPQQLLVAVNRCVPSVGRPPSDVLELVADAARKSPRGLGPFFNLLAVSMLSKDLLGHMETDHVGPARRRLVGCRAEIGHAVLETCEMLRKDRQDEMAATAWEGLCRVAAKTDIDPDEKLTETQVDEWLQRVVQ